MDRDFTNTLPKKVDNSINKSAPWSVCFVHVTISWQERDGHACHGMHTEGVVSYFTI